MSLFTQIAKIKHIRAIIVIGFFTVSAMGWFAMWLYGRYYVTTDNAYINANVVQIAPRITGRVVVLNVNNNQYVKQGQPLFSLDKEAFQIAVDSAHAQVEISEAQLAKAAITSKRTEALVKRKYLSPQEGDNAMAQLKTATAQLAHAKAALRQAELNLAYTDVLAPISGWVTNVTLRVGDVVIGNQPLFALISDEEFWADANFKETEMAMIKPGQKAKIVTDLYPKHPFEGVVESISGGAGGVFSLLPPQNATGNWVKVTQRIPAHIRILNPDPHKQLRIGISATVTVNIKEQRNA